MFGVINEYIEFGQAYQNTEQHINVTLQNDTQFRTNYRPKYTDYST